jgi:hypothetical protein
VAHGGNPYDNIGQHVIGLSEELSKLRMFKNYVDRNPMVAENMNSVNMRVIERIDQVKKEIHQLQSPARYAEFAEAFTATEAKVIPEEIMNDWIDRLTIRTFNEELKNVFPYIFKLVSENDIPVKELTIEDLVNEEACKICSMDPCECDHSDGKEVKEFAEYESILNRIAEGADLFSQDQAQQDAAIEKLNQIIAQPLPVGTDGNNVIEALSDLIDDDELTDIFKELADVNPEHDARDILKDYIELKDKENGTDVLSKVNFEQGAEPAEPAEAPPEVPAEPTGAAPAEPAPAEQPVTASVDHNKDDIPFDGPYRKSSDNKDQFGNTVKHKARHLAKKGLAAAIANAKKAGMKAEDVIEMNGQQMTLASVIEAAGMQVEDFFGNKEQSESNELVEFVKSMYNMEEGSFPKGETGVLIAVEKKFGERAVPIAHKVIGKLHQLGEMTRMKQLAGMR